MKNFDEIKQQWAARELPQPPQQGFHQIVEQSAQLRKKQRITKIVLGCTVLILLLFFLYIAAYKNTQTFWGLGIMIGSLLIRIILEYVSRFKEGKLPVDENMISYNKKLEVYYMMRKQLHYILTPLLFGSYILGFVLLLPAFKENLSPGFYTYILFSSIVVFVSLAMLIIIQIRKELRILRSIKK